MSFHSPTGPSHAMKIPPWPYACAEEEKGGRMPAKGPLLFQLEGEFAPHEFGLVPRGELDSDTVAKDGCSHDILDEFSMGAAQRIALAGQPFDHRLQVFSREIYSYYFQPFIKISNLTF